MFIKMIPEIGHFALIIALLMAAVQAVMPLAGAATPAPAVDGLWSAHGGGAVCVHCHCLRLFDRQLYAGRL